MIWAKHAELNAIARARAAARRMRTRLADGPMRRKQIDELLGRGILVGSLCGKAEHAKAQRAVGVDIIVAQGTEAGGHTGQIATMVLVPQVVGVRLSGRLREGAEFLSGVSGPWHGLTSFMRTHNWWHLALFALELEERGFELEPEEE